MIMEKCRKGKTNIIGLIIACVKTLVENKEKRRRKENEKNRIGKITYEM